MKCLLLTIYLILQTAFELCAQEFGYTRYDSKEGLAGSTVYCMTQDKEGFLWFGTETGLSRFDGTHFKNFFTRDGLPSNDIIQLFTDSKGRVWIAPFKKAVCYYYKGRIYTPDNDSILRRIRIDNFIVRFAEDNEGNLLMQDHHTLHLLYHDGRVANIDTNDCMPLSDIADIGPCPEGGFVFVEKSTVWMLQHNRINLLRRINLPYSHFNYCNTSRTVQVWRGDSMRVTIRSLVTGKIIRCPFSHEHLNFNIIDDSLVGICKMDGAQLRDLNHPDSVQYFLTNISVTNMLRDFEGNYWFSTRGQGVYRLNSPFIKSLRLRKKNSSYNQQVLCIERSGRCIVAGCDMNTISLLDPETGKPLGEPVELQTFRPVVALAPLADNQLVYGSSSLLVKTTSGFKTLKQMGMFNVKAFYPMAGNILVATDRHIMVLDPVRFVITDTLWRERATTLFVDDNTIYFGSLNGLYCRLPDKTIQYLGEKIPELRNRITAIRKDGNDLLWIATYDQGLVAYRNGQIFARINNSNGLTSNICRTLFLDGNTLWAGTDRGLNKIDLTKKNYPVQKYTTGDGLNSDIINALYVENNKVFVGTAEGISFFDARQLYTSSRCELVFTDITISGKSRQWDSTSMLIPHNKNNIRFDYAGISFKSAGDIRYRYRLLGLDSAWKETRETFLSYPTLPSGDYALQLQAVNKFDVYSRVITAKFTIEKLLWEKNWFRLLAGFIFLGLTGLLVWVIVYRIRRREEEKTAIGKRIGELEQLARKAQMNPHFIFNSLNSIQQYVMDTDLAGANKFITGFSRLIRQTLEFSARQEISLEEEIDYLSNYLELEKSRLEDAFSWQVIIPDTIYPAEYYLPPMILQPFVENSVRHGLRLRKDKAGKITIRIQKEHNFLICIVEDNGVGRKAAQRLKSSSHIEYQSRGMSLTAERIALLNKDNPKRITLQIEDLEDDAHLALGTRVTISFPIK